MILEKLTEVINAANASYIIEYEEASMFNVRADKFIKGFKFAYIEEFKEGEINLSKSYFYNELTKIQVSFSQISENRLTALQREQIRDNIKEEIVRPFIALYNKNNNFERVNKFKIYSPLARFDANEISIVIEFDCIELENNCE